LKEERNGFDVAKANYEVSQRGASSLAKWILRKLLLLLL
jgi:hypothetical protein